MINDYAQLAETTNVPALPYSAHPSSSLLGNSSAPTAAVFGVGSGGAGGAGVGV